MTPEIKQRIEQIRQGEVPDGYQKIKDGIFPIDWHIQRMKQWITLAERPITLEDDQNYYLVTVRRGFGGVDLRGEYFGKNILVKNYFTVRQGDFLISKRQIAHGACGVVPEPLDGAVVSNEYNVFVPNQGTNIAMFNLMMQLPHYTRLFYLMSDGVHIEKLLFKTQAWMKRQLAMPPLEEQKKIASILITQDRVIELKEKRLAEKQRQKKYLMQQLLTGKKRASEFRGKWEKVQLRNALSVCHGQNQHSVEQENGMYPILGTGGEIGRTNSFLYDKPSILIGRKGSINKPMYIEIPFWTIDTLFYCKIKQGYYPKFLFFKFQSINWNKYDESSGIPSLSASTIGSVEILVPEFTEQIAIAKVLSTADREIDLLRQDIEQEKKKKKALMQLLLTGIVRVKV